LVKKYSLNLTGYGALNDRIIQRPIPSQIARIFLNQSIHLLAKPIRWALNNGVTAHARRRMGFS